MNWFGSFSLSEVFVKTVSSNLAARKKILLDINQNFRGTVSFSKNDQLSLLKDGGRLEGERRRGGRGSKLYYSFLEVAPSLILLITSYRNFDFLPFLILMNH